MSRHLSFHQSLLEQCRSRISQGRFAEARSLLERLIAHPLLESTLAAEANFLLARVQFELVDTDAAEASARKADAACRGRAEYHLLLGETLEDQGQTELALEQFGLAARLAPGSDAAVLRYARAVARHKSADRGVRLIQAVYAKASDDPEIVAAVVEGLVEGDRLDDAELVVTQSNYRHPGDRRFRQLRDRFRQLRVEHMLRGSAKGHDGSSESVPYRNPAVHGMGKPGGARRPVRREAVAASAKASLPAGPLEPIPVDRSMTHVEMLRRGGTAVVGPTYESLGLLGKVDTRSQAEEISRYFVDVDSLSRVVRQLPTASRRLLKTLVRAGGYVPAASLYQTTAEDAPPPDYVQPILRAGIAFFGRPTREKKTALVLVVPSDLMGRLARILRVKVGE